MSQPSDDVRAWFTIQGPELDRSEVIVSKSEGLTMGRGAENDLRLRHREVSRRHLHIYWGEEGKFVLEDTNSSNGVWLNDVRLTPNMPAELNEGDLIRVGPYVLRLEGYLFGEGAAPPAEVDGDGRYPEQPRELFVGHLPGLPRNRSNWMKYLPAVFSEDEFLGRYMLIFESIYSPLIWLIDNFDLFLTPDMAPSEWLQWIAGWFDVLLLPELPIDRQRQLMNQLGWLFMRRGTPAGLQRLLELYFGVSPEIVETDLCSFTVIMSFEESPLLKRLGQDGNVVGHFSAEEMKTIADRLIWSQKPAFASYTLQVS